MSDDKEPHFKGRHRKRTEQERQAEERKEEAKRKIQNTQCGTNIGTVVNETLTEVQGYRTEQRTQAKEKRPFDMAAVFFLFLTTVFTGLTYRVFYRQLEEMGRETRQQQDIAQRQLRAYVGVQKIELTMSDSTTVGTTDESSPGHVFEDHLDITIANSGVTPAFHVEPVYNLASVKDLPPRIPI